MEGVEASEVLEGLELEGSTTTGTVNFSTDVGAINITFYPYYQHSVYVAASFVLAYFSIFLLCMVGNILVCLIVVENRHMRTVINLFILNLAVSDLLVGIFCIPTTLVDNLITGWPFSKIVCKMSGFVQGVSVSASVFTLVAIAVERFRCIVYPLHPKPTICVAQAAILLIWVLAVAIMCPAALALTVEQIPNHYIIYNDDLNHTLPIYSCYENFANPRMTKVYTVVLFVHIYLVPLTVITIMYVSIGVKLCSSVLANREPPVADGTVEVRVRRGGQPMISRKKLMVIKMLILVALLFMLSWLPLWTLMMMADYAGLDSDQVDLLTSYIFPFAHWLAFANSSINPIIYGYYNENFKRGFQAVCKSRPLCCLLQCHHCERMTRWGKRDRSMEEPHQMDGTSARNHIDLRVRNRVHNSARLKDAEEVKRHVRAAVRPQRENFDQTIEMAILHNKDHHSQDSNRVSSLEASVYKAWEK